jgi:starch phosphorylase
VPAGHDCFPANLVTRLLGARRADLLESGGLMQDGELNMTLLAMHASHFVNGVALRHGEVSREMFPDRDIHAITNGVHAATWASPPFCDLFDRRIPAWRSDNQQLRHAVGIPLPEIERAHAAAKRRLITEIAARSGEHFDPKRLTIGFARRATAYKRAHLLFSDSDRLASETRRFGGLQVVMAGKAHPRDRQGKEIIRKIFAARSGLADRVPVAYLEDYDMNLGGILSAGVDVWLNTPERPLEASGTSGMKAALNGVPSLSILDGWWIEGAIEGVTGWSIGHDGAAASDWHRDSAALYDKLEREVMPTFYERPEEFARIRRSCIAFNASFFNTQRMVCQYAQNAYGLASSAADTNL